MRNFDVTHPKDCSNRPSRGNFTLLHLQILLHANQIMCLINLVTTLYDKLLVELKFCFKALIDHVFSSGSRNTIVLTLVSSLMQE